MYGSRTLSDHDGKWSYHGRRDSYEKVETFKYFDSIFINQNYIQEEIKCMIKARNSCYYSVQTILSKKMGSYIKGGTNPG